MTSGVHVEPRMRPGEHAGGLVVSERETEDVLLHPMEDRERRDGARVPIGQTRLGRYLRVVTKQRSKPAAKRRSLGFVICIHNDGYEVSLERLKLYRALYDADARQNQQIRVIDESSDDYIHPARMFATIDVPQAVRRAAR